MTTTTIDLTPTWRGILPALLALVENPITRQDGLDELARMADAADKYNDLVSKVQYLPKREDAGFDDFDTQVQAEEVYREW